MADGSIKLFGFEIKRAGKEEDPKKKPSIVPARDDDGAGYVTASAMYYGQYLNIDGDDSKDNHQMIMQYRGVATQPEVDMAIEDIVNESISSSELKQNVELDMDNLEIPDTIKKKIKEEFDGIYNMLAFGEYGHDIFRRWYVDGRLFHHLVVNESNIKAGIVEIRPIDAAKIRKVKQVKTKTDQATGAKLIENVDEYFIYQEKPGSSVNGVKMTLDSVSYVTSGLLSEDRKKVVSYLHKALKPINQLRMMEDSLVIYRLARAPERRIFYIDVGNLPKGKAEQYMKDIMSRYRNKLVYDAKTGEIRDDRKHMSMLEDFWLPRREGGKGTEITTLPGGDNLGQIDDILYFQKRLYRALNVPISRLNIENDSMFSLGRSTEVSRDELKYQKFIDRLRKRFAQLFLGILKRQLILKGIITDEDWELIKNDIIVDFIRDNHFTELRDAELLTGRLQMLDQINNYVGSFFSKQYIYKNVLMMDDDEIDEIKKQIEEEQASGEIPDMNAPEDQGGGGQQPDQAPQDQTEAQPQNDYLQQYADAKQQQQESKILKINENRRLK